MSGIFSLTGTIWASDRALLSETRSVTLVQADQGPVAQVVSGPHPGLQLSAWRVGAGDPLSFDAASLGGAGRAGITPQLVQASTAGGRDMALVLGAGDGLSGFWQTEAGGFDTEFQPQALGAALPADLQAVAVVPSGAATLVYGLVPGSTRPILWRMDEAGRLALSHPGSTGDPDRGLSDLVISGPFLVTGGAQGGALLEVHRISTAGGLTRVDHLRDDENPGLAGPVVLAEAQIGSARYVIVGAANSSTLSVYELSRSGALVLTDHVIDTRDSRFAGVTQLEVVTRDGMVWLAAAGSDHGVSLFRLLPGGRLVHEGVQADTLDASLDGVAGLDLGLDASARLVLVTAGLRDAGLSSFVYDPGPAGQSQTAAGSGSALTGGAAADLLMGRDGADTLMGGAGRDVLRDGGGADDLTGGAGADLFVFDTDGRPETVHDFNPAEDRLDLSGWAFLRSLDALQINARANGAEIFFAGPAGDEYIALIAHDGQPIDPAVVRAAIVAGPDRFLPDWLNAPALRPPDGDDPGALRLRGSSVADVLDGGAANDTIEGRAGSDVLGGSLGDDSLNGGIGWDTMLGGSGNDTLRGMDGYDSLEGGSGDDWITGNNGFDLAEGGDGRDSLYGGLGTDTLLGGAGDDLLQGDPGTDWLDGQGGDDLLRGNAGPDTLLGGLGRDTLEGGINLDRLEGGGGDDLLLGGNARDTLLGGAGNDTLSGNSGNDWIEGGGGWDVLNGGRGADSFVFRGGGTAVIEDFANNIDTVLLDPVLWGGGGRSAAQILETAYVAQGDAVLDFGPMGQVVLQGVASLNGLLNDIELL